MIEKRRWPRNAPAAGQQLLTVHGPKRHVFGRILDESPGGLGIHLAEPGEFSPGESLLVHRLEPHELSLATVRHVSQPPGRGTVIGVEWANRSVGNSKR